MAEDNDVLEVSTFQCRECYVYAPLPPVTSLGHRAEAWNVEKWLKALRLTVVKVGDNLVVRLLDQDTGELFAECPVPNDIPIAISVEPVTDSSRYFVLKVVDRSTKNHAFIGVGFRDRNEATDFCAALDDHRQYLRRQKEAEQMREDFESRESEAGPSQDMSLQGSIKLNLTSSLKKTVSASESSLSRKLPLQVSADGAGLLKLAPPPGPSGAQATTQNTAMRTSLSGDEQTTAQARTTQPSSTTSQPAAAAAAPDDDDWGDFVS